MAARYADPMAEGSVSRKMACRALLAINNRPVASRGQQGARAALEVDDAALPAGARQALGDRADEADVGVADDEPRAGEPAFAQEPEPARVGLGVDGRDAGHAAHPVGAVADGGGNRRGLHPAVPPALDVGGQDNVGNPDFPEVPGDQLCCPCVHRPAHRAGPVLREPLYTHSRAIRSIFLVETPSAHDSATAAAAARSVRGYLSIRPVGKCVPAHSVGMRSAMSPGGGWPVLARGSRCVRWPRPRGPCPPVRP